MPELLGWLGGLLAARIMAEVEAPARRVLLAAAAFPERRAATVMLWLLLLPLGWAMAGGPAWSLSRMLDVPWAPGVVTGVITWSAMWLVVVARNAWHARQVRLRFWNAPISSRPF